MFILGVSRLPPLTPTITSTILTYFIYHHHLPHTHTITLFVGVRGRCGETYEGISMEEMLVSMGLFLLSIKQKMGVKKAT